MLAHNRWKKGEWPEDLATLCGISSQDKYLLETALTHPSYVYEHPQDSLEHNQRLEFLGDAVLGLVVGEFLYQKYPRWQEGELTRMRAAVVREQNLAESAKSLGLGSWMKLGRGEEISGGRERTSILADALEAVIGASYLAGGMSTASSFVLDLFREKLEGGNWELLGDHKTTLQEWAQRHGHMTVKYRILEETGPDHNKRFVSGAYLQGELVSTGEGRTKKEAEQQAAKKALLLGMENLLTNSHASSPIGKAQGTYHEQ